MRRRGGRITIAAAAGLALSGLALSGPATAGDAPVVVTPSKVAADKPAEAAGGDDAGAVRIIGGEATAVVDSLGGFSVSGSAVLSLGENGAAGVALNQERIRRLQAWERDPYAALPRPPVPLR